MKLRKILYICFNDDILRTIVTLCIVVVIFLGINYIPFEVATYNIYGIGVTVGYLLGIVTSVMIELNENKSKS